MILVSVGSVTIPTWCFFRDPYTSEDGRWSSCEHVSIGYYRDTKQERALALAN